MKNYAKYLLGLFALAALTACGGSSDGGGSKPEVTFKTELITRAESGLITAFSNGDRMSLYCSEMNSITGANPTIHAATYGDGVWRPAPSITLDKEERRYLFAIYPYDANATDAAAYPVTVASQTDYLFSGTGVMATTEALQPTLRMRHAMATLAFNIRSYVGGKLEAVTIENEDFPIEGTLRVTGSITPTKFGSYTKNFNTALSQQGFTTDHPSIFVIPHQISTAGLKIKMTISGTAYELLLPATNLTSSKKYVASVLHTAQGVSLAEGELEVIALDEPSDAKGEEVYSVIKVSVSGNGALAPVLTGNDPYGFIYWGDGSKEIYSATAGHGYGAEGTYVVTVDAWNAEEVMLNKLTNVVELDLSKF